MKSLCSDAMFLKEMLMFRYTVVHMNANIHLVMNSFGTLFHDKIFSLTFPWHVSNSLTFPDFPHKWSPWVKQPTAKNRTLSLTSVEYTNKIYKYMNKIMQS